MEQLHFSGAFSRSKSVADKVMCFQVTKRGRFVGTLSSTDAGYTGHILAPKHAVLPGDAGSGSLGFLHANRHEAYVLLAMHVAKHSWDGQLGFDASCLQALDEVVKRQFEYWLVDIICNIRASAIHAGCNDGDRRKDTVRLIRDEVITERAVLLSAQQVDRASGSGLLQ